ncbi:hypothetical protein T10_5097 [Trichinella papuae]|uniref:Uncharacterized protein n=1 Tax=Trichinella papuae TaxID=268474 RepID=A0A0V1MKF5_9BILA|nr:hypothetical protein T10_5097 [Trichinella papuae]
MPMNGVTTLQRAVHIYEDAVMIAFNTRAVTFVLRLNVKESLRCTWLEGHIKDTTIRCRWHMPMNGITTLQRAVHIYEDAAMIAFNTRTVTFVLRLNVKESLRCTWLEGHIKDTTV